MRLRRSGIHDGVIVQNQMLGWCQEHTRGRCMDFNSIADAELLFQDMISKDVHLMHEVSGLNSQVPMAWC
jgi:hypothetical protein